MCKLGDRVVRDPAVSPRFLYDWRQAPEGLDYANAQDRLKAVSAASGAADVLWSSMDRVNAWGKPDTPAHEWIRYFANRWVDIAENSWLKEHPAAWAECEGVWQSSDENPWVFAVDMALKHDSVAVDRIEQLPDGNFAVTAKIWNAKDYGGRIPHDEVWTYICDNAKGLGFRGVVYDPRYFEVPARLLAAYNVPAIEFDQTPQRMAPACGLAYELIVNHQVVHNGDPDLASHIRTPVDYHRAGIRGGFVLRKGKSKGHIDAAIAMVMGLMSLHAEQEPEPTPMFAYV
jgi:hypothetical protein